MSTLLLRLAGPLQSWGSDAKFDRRGTERVPTKSGVIGLIAAALGRQRHESVEDLLVLRFGVRVDREGKLLRDYHTATTDDKKDTFVTNRYYLSDAAFLVGLEGEETMLREIDEAIRRPAYPLFLGRRSCPPEGQLSLGIREGKPLLKALQEEKFLVQDPPDEIRFVYDAGPDDAFYYMLRDLPVSFNHENRRHGFRRVAEKTIVREDKDPVTEHDPFSQLGG